MGFFSGLTSIAGPVMAIAGAATGNLPLALAGIGVGAVSASQGQADANQANRDIANQTNQMSSEQAALTREFNANEAKKNRDYQTQMSNTSYQRATADMMAAGLNPMLTVSQGGASTPTGSSASATAAQMVPAAKQENINSQNAATAIQGAQLMLGAQNSAADIQLKNQQAQLATAQQEQAWTQAAANKADAARTMSQTYNPNQFGKFVDSQISQNRANALLQGNTAQNVKDLVAPTSDPWYLRNLKSLHNSALDSYNKRAGSNGATIQLFKQPLGR